METTKTNLIILGSGPAGCTAAIYAARSNIKPIMVNGTQPGGQLTITTDVENYPGFRDPVLGPDLMDGMINQAKNVGCEVLNEQITNINLDVYPYVLESGLSKSFITKSIIIATGASAKWLGLENEEKYRGHGVSACATCDAFFFKGKKVAVVGGGNTAIEEALFLSKFAKEVIVIHRRNKLRAEKILQERAFSNNKISFIWDTTVVDINGEDNPKILKNVTIKSLKNDSTSSLELDGVFIAIGHEPNTLLFKNKLELDNQGYLKVFNQVYTNKKGVFAAGDVHDKIFRQAVTAAGYGCMAALEVEKFLESQE
ncbi:MAG: thioredoxin-disulfide reductase [Rickettsiales bacterium]|nr:thioredoxin-disulfide reductase [Rickettsiales bacterium]OUV83517.1 MAG: thioredoxin-disulfide reductase [Rickettsiales bacterium TMED131]